MRSKRIDQAGWGRWPAADGPAFRPERLSELTRLVQGGGAWLARGAGRSYGDQAQISGGNLALTERLDRLISFDPANGELVAEPGVSFAALLKIFLPRGWMVPVSPGTGFATLGGAVANDVHGKNHDRDGSFGDHLLWFDLLMPSGDIHRIDPDSQPALFRATLGGCGLTGIITALCLRLRRVPGNAVNLTETRMRDLDQFLACLLDARQNAAYSVGWIDALAEGRHLGRGILETAEPADRLAPTPPEKGSSVSFDLPGGALNRFSVKLFNHFYARRVPATGRQRLVSFAEFLYPLDAVGRWNRIYGKRGFHQFQCVLPDDQAAHGLPLLLETIAKAGAASFLAVLKSLGSQGRGYLSFPMRGFTLALDLPHRSGSLELLGRLERLVLDHGGRIYLAKDSAVSAAGLAAMYPDLTEFRTVLAELGGPARFTSAMAHRLGLGEQP